MATILPFQAIRASRDKAHLLASRSYVSYSEETLKEKLENNPYTFLHIINPEYNKKNKLHGIEKFKLVKKKFMHFIKKGYLLQDKKKSFYLYQQSNQDNIFQGIIAASSIHDYTNGIIKKHEQTLTEREEMFKDYLDITSFNADPVLLAYKANQKINQVIEKKKNTRPEYEFTTTNKVLHKLWVINEKSEINVIISSFQKINKMYIADGHHRTSSSALLSKQRNLPINNDCNFFMSFLISEEQLKIINFNRVIKNLNGLSKDEFLKKIEKNFTVQITTECIAKNKDEIGMYLSGKNYLLKVKKGSYIDDCVNRLDPAILSKNILAPILGIVNEKTDKNISFLAGDQPLSKIKEMVDIGDFAVAFILKPISINALKKVAEKNQVMPPKSTYIEPKLRSGLVIYPIHDNC